MKFISRLLLIAGIITLFSTAGASDIELITLQEVIQGIIKGFAFLAGSYIIEFIRLALA